MTSSQPPTQPEDELYEIFRANWYPDNTDYGWYNKSAIVKDLLAWREREVARELDDDRVFQILTRVYNQELPPSEAIAALRRGIKGEEDV